MDEAKLSKRARVALEVLKAGGEFVCRLERGYRGREVWRYRLKSPAGAVVSGIGIAAFYELERLLVPTSSTSVSTSYRLRDAAAG